MDKIKLKKLIKKEKNNLYEYDPSNNAFEVVINNSYNCHEHIITTRHMKFEFMDKFYGIIFAIKLSYFPKSIIIRNYDDVEYFGTFVVCLRGLSLIFEIKENIFYLKNKKEFFQKFKKLLINIILSIVNRSSINLEAAQKQFFKYNNNILIMNKNSYPSELRKKENQINENFFNNKSKNKQTVDMQFTIFYCLKNFVQANNNNQACVYHLIL